MCDHSADGGMKDKAGRGAQRRPRTALRTLDFISKQRRTGPKPDIEKGLDQTLL